MTSPAPFEQTDRLKAALRHGTTFWSAPDAQPVTSDCLVSNESRRASSGVPHSPKHGERPQDHFARMFERHNAPQMKKDARERWPFWSRLMFGILIGLVAVSVAHSHRMSALEANWERIHAE